MRTDSWVLLGFTGVLVLTIAVQEVIDYFVPRRRARVTQKWVDDNVPGAGPDLVRHIDTELATRGLVGAGGGLLGWIVGGPLIAVQLIDQTDDPTPTLGLAPMIGVVVGSLAAQSVYTVRQARHSRPPSGRRVSLSLRPQLRWFLAPPACGVAMLGIAIVLGLGALRLRQYYAGILSPSATTTVVIVSVLAEVGFVAIAVACIPWMVRRPLHSPDQDWLRAGLALRRSEINYLVILPYPLIMNLAYTLHSGPLEFRQVGWPDLPLGLLLPASSTFLVGALFWACRDRVPYEALGLPQPPRPANLAMSWLRSYRAPSEWEPAPGTNGWINPFRPGARRPSSHPRTAGSPPSGSVG